MAGLLTGKRTVLGPYSRDGKDHRLSRRRRRCCIRSSLRAVGLEEPLMTQP